MLAPLLSSYVEVILPLPIGNTFTYSVPETMQGSIAIGSRVIVPFGKKKFYTGIVTNFAPIAPRDYQVKEVLHVLDPKPILRYPQLKLWEWISEYYLCSIGDVYKAAIPNGLKIESETMMELNPDFDAEDLETLTEREVIAFQVLSVKGKMSLSEIGKETGFANIPSLMNRMAQKGAVIISENLAEKYRAKKEKYVRLAFSRGDDDARIQAFAKVKGAKKQEAMLLTLLQISDFNNLAREIKEITQNELLAETKLSPSILKALVDKGIVDRFTKEVSRFKSEPCRQEALPTLSETQLTAKQELIRELNSKAVTLLHGVTSSGKTELYVHLIDACLKEGRQVLYLVPEIALTTQLTSRLRNYFGHKLIVYHSKFSDNERVEIWNTLLHSNDSKLIVGVRSSVFLPFAKLGLIIVDEEHDQSYKQFEPAPRYNARDTAIMLAYMHGAKTVLGSATPSVESYYKALSGKYGLVTLSNRYGGVKLPEMEMIDMAKEWKKKTVDGFLAADTINAVNNAVANSNQAIIFHNRRGYAPMAHCTKCQFIPKCQYCDVSLTYHRRADALVCHYCGTSYPLPSKCPVCQEPTIEISGYGTERIEEEVERIFPDAKTLRLDLDTTRNKNSYQNIIEMFSEHKADILVGTQMVTKGLDFGDVSVVCVANADSLLNYPDFHSSERTFDMLEQVSGRAGRREKEGKVLIQTRTPEHWVLDCVKNHDYSGFYAREIAEREKYLYPPFVKLIYINLKHRDERELDNLAQLYSQELRKLFGTRVFGPAAPPVARIQSLYIRQIMLKIELNASMKKVKEILRELQANLHAKVPAMRNLIIYYDVDPY